MWVRRTVARAGEGRDDAKSDGHTEEDRFMQQSYREVGAGKEKRGPRIHVILREADE